MIFDRFADLKYEYGNWHLWAKRYWVSAAGLNEARIRKNMREQENVDRILEEVSVKELETPFRGS